MKKLTRVLAAVMAILISAGSTGVFAVTAVKTENNTSASSVSSEDEKSFDVKKEETVYIVADAQGNKKNVIVSDWLDNEAGLSSIRDRSALSGIENVKGDETYKLNGEDVEWAANGADIYYKGTTDKELPVSVNLTYYLDGNEISPEELAGKSGRVTVRYNYTNNQRVTVKHNGKSQDMYVPFMMVSASILDSSNFSNIEVTNGKYISDGERFIVIGMAVPGLKESLGFDDKKDIDIDIPEYFEFSADVTDFSMSSSITAATNELFSDVDFDDVETMDDLDEKIKELTDASEKLTDGSSDLYDGIKSLLDGTGSLEDGASELYSGAYDLMEGAGTLADGTQQFADGTAAAADGAASLDSGISSAKDGASELTDGAKRLSEGFSPILDGASALNDGVSAVLDGSKQVESGAKSLSDGTSQLESGSKTLSDSAKQLDDGIASVKDGSEQLKSGIEEAAGGIGQLSDGADNLSSGLGNLSAGLDQAGSSLDETISYNKQVLEGLKAVYEQTQDDNIAGMIGVLEQTIAGQEQISASMKDGGALKDGTSQLIDGASALGAGIDSLEEGSAALSEGIKAVDDGLASLRDGSSQISAGTDTLYNSVVKVNKGASDLFSGTSNLAQANDALQNGAEQLKEGVKTAQSGADALYSGAAALNDGLSKLKDGSSALADGADTLNASVAALESGAFALYDGSGSLLNGMSSLKDGVSELSDGAGQLESGSKELKEGMAEFKKDGIDKIADMYNGDIKDLIDRFKDLNKISREYNSFSGIGNDMDGSVKFIFTIDGIQNKE
ncbi:hypothetical protein [Porcipelethomonas sp.]|uniref:hypothetical protein n=1 Tax=Porcipelethomonas sp. TaxID=2981675 RepID=UPI003EF9B24F